MINSTEFRPYILAHFVFLTAIVGCVGRYETQPTNVIDTNQAAEDDAASISGLEAAQAKLKRDGNGNVTTVDFRGTSVADETLSHLTGLPALRSLLLNDTPITDSGLETIGKLSTLTNLDLRGCDVSNTGLESISDLSNLKALRFSGKSGKTRNISDDAMDVIAKFTKLKVLALDYLKFTCGAEGLSKLSNLSEMQELYIGNTLVNDETLRVISENFPKLRKLRASASQVSDAGLAHVSKLAHLEELDVSENSQLFDTGLEYLAGMQQLKKLNFYRLQITDDGVAYLSDLTNLEWLNLDNIGYLSDDGLAYLKDMKKLTFLHAGSNAISDDGLVHLKPLSALEELIVTRTGVTEEGVAELKKTLPNTKIQLKYIEE